MRIVTEHKSFKVCCCFDVFFLFTALENNLHFSNSVSASGRHSCPRHFSSFAFNHTAETELHCEGDKRLITVEQTPADFFVEVAFSCALSTSQIISFLQIIEQPELLTVDKVF